MAFGIGRLLGRTVTGAGGLDGVERVLAHIARGPVQVAPDRCTRARHRLSKCSACRDACPFAAIELPSSKEVAPPRIDPSKCSGCGLCIPACPTEALASDRRPLPKPGDGQQSVACGPAAALGANAEVIVPCLGAVEPTFWLEGTGRCLTIYRAGCDTCPIPGGGAAFERNLAVARTIAGLKGGEICSTLQDVTAVAPERRGQVEEARLSRRDFFRLAGREARADVLAAVLPPDSGQAWRGGHLRGRAGLRRRAIAAHLPDKIAEAAPFSHELPLWQLTLDSARCRGCGLCAEVCPEGALGWSENRPADDHEESGTVLAFDLAFCDGCRLCIDVCPQQAVSLNRAEPPWRTGSQALLDGQRRSCDRCGATFFAAHDERACRRCTLMAEATLDAVFGRLAPDEGA